jgi:hypothetical protein
VWDATDGRLIALLAGHQLAPRAAEFAPDGRHVLTASDDKTVRLWEAESGRCLRVFSGHLGRVRTARFNANGSLIVTASDDGTARVWDGASGQGLLTLSFPDIELRSARFSPDGTRLVTGGAGGGAVIYELLGSVDPPPPWFAGFLRLLVAGTLNPNGEIESISSRDLAHLRSSIEPPALADRSRYGDIARYYLTPGGARPVRPGSLITRGAAADALIVPDAGQAQIERAYAFDPAHPLVHLALARFESDATRAEFLRDHSLGRLPADAPAALLLRAADLLARQPGQERRELQCIERAEAVAPAGSLTELRGRKAALLKQRPPGP